MKKLISSAAIAALLALGVVAGATMSASATETCTPSEAYDETVIDTPYQAAVPGTPGTDAVPEVAEVSHTEYQRYSWTGGPTDYAPSSTPASAPDDWQANTTNYEGAGHGDDPIGEPFAKNDNGKGDWFFWTSTVVIDQAYVPGVDAVPGTEGTPEVAEVSHVVHHEAVTCDDDEDPYIELCTSSVDHPVATNLDQDGWNIKPNRGEFVDGGLHLYSTADSSGWAQKTINTPLANIGSLATGYSNKTGVYTFGVILTLNDWDQQIHFDEDGRYWTDQSGIFPESTLKGGYYETYDLAADLISNPVIQTIVLYVNAGQGGLVIHSQGYQCGTQQFDYDAPIVVPEKPADRVVMTEASVTDCETSTVTTTTTTSTYGTTYNDSSNTWVENAEPTITTATSDRAATAEECPVAVTPKPATPAATPVVADTLAQTGSGLDVVAWLTIGAYAAAIGAAFTVLSALARRRKH